jgi:hypothetical protein
LFFSLPVYGSESLWLGAIVPALAILAGAAPRCGILDEGSFIAEVDPVSLIRIACRPRESAGVHALEDDAHRGSAGIPEASKVRDIEGHLGSGV